MKKASKKLKLQPEIVNIRNGKYFIRHNIDAGIFWYISGPPHDVEPGQDMHAITKNIDRDTRNTKIRERDLAPECFVDVINRKNGNILLRQSGTDRYATVLDEDIPKIAFLSSSPDTIGKDGEFQLIGPTGKDSVGVAIFSVATNCFVEIELETRRNINASNGYLYPVLWKLSLMDLVRFERRFGYF